MKIIADYNIEKATIVNLPATVPLSYNFQRTIGSADVYMDKDGSIMAEITIEDKSMLEKLNKLYPATAGVVKEKIGSVITRYSLSTISLCDKANQDETIKTVAEQLKV